MCLRVLSEHTDCIASVAVLGNRIVSGSWDGTIRVWNLEDGTCLRTLSDHDSGVYSVYISGNRIVSGSRAGSRAGTVRVWDLETGTCLRTLSGHRHYILPVSVSRNRIVSGSWDGTVRMWDLEQLQSLDDDLHNVNAEQAMLLATLHDAAHVHGNTLLARVYESIAPSVKAACEHQHQ